MSFTETVIGFFPKIHGALRRAGITETAWFERVYPTLYFTYKRRLEDPFAGLVRRRPELFRGGNVLDVGANIGYTSLLFARALSPGFRVFAFEPEQRNFDALTRSLRRHGAEDRVVAVRSAVGDRGGVILLRLNEEHRGDHRISTAALPVTEALKRTQEVEVVTIDEFVEERGLGPIGFVKVDVQGYETSVLRGMRRLLAGSPELTVAVEYAPDLLGALGFRPAELLELFDEGGWIPHVLSRNGALTRTTSARVAERAGPKGYHDLVFARRELSS